MTLSFGSISFSADIDPAQALVIRHAYVREHPDVVRTLDLNPRP